MFPEGRILDFVIVGVVALIVVGPKDLPLLMRKLGRFVAHMRGMAAEFRASFDEMARQSELDELRREVEAMRAGQPLKAAVGLEDAHTQVFDDIHAGLRDAPPLSAAPTFPPEGAKNASPDPSFSAPAGGSPAEGREGGVSASEPPAIETPAKAAS